MDQERLIIDVPFCDNTTGRREVLKIFLADNGRTYAALLPVTATNTPEPGARIELVRADPCVDGQGREDYSIDAIKSDMELDCAEAAFRKLNIQLPEPETVDTEPLDKDTSPLPIVMLEDEYGVQQEWQVVSSFPVEERSYVALMLVPEFVTEETDGTHIILCRAEEVTQNGQEGLMISSIEKEEEYEKVSQVFESLIL